MYLLEEDSVSKRFGFKHRDSSRSIVVLGICTNGLVLVIVIHGTSTMGLFYDKIVGFGNVENIRCKPGLIRRPQEKNY